MKIVIQIIVFSVNPWKSSPHCNNIKYAEGFQRLHTGVKLRYVACLSLQILSFVYNTCFVFQTKK